MVLLLFVLALLLPPADPSAERCFTQTGFCIAGPIRAYWERNGGLAVFGYPIGPQQADTIETWIGPVQWFERDRLEDHANQGLGVLAGRLGAETLERPNRRVPSTDGVDGAEPGCVYFAITRHSLCEPFLSYWRTNGGLERFGYPLTQKTSENLLDPVSGQRHPFDVQYFERRRMEHHTEYAGTRYEVLLALFGAQIRQTAGCEPADSPLTNLATREVNDFGCPYWVFPPLDRGVRASQRFEHGSMVYVAGYYRYPGQIYAVFSKDGRLVWRLVNDSWNETMPEPPSDAPPGLLAPVRGFGKAWRENPEIRAAIGYALSAEYPERGVRQLLTNGSMLYAPSLQVAYLLDPGSGVGGGLTGGNARDETP